MTDDPSFFIYHVLLLQIIRQNSILVPEMKSVLIISPKEDEARLIRESMPSEYQVENADSVQNALRPASPMLI